MKHKLLNKLWLRVGMIVAIMTTALAGTAWAESVVINTTNFTKPNSGSGYAAYDGTRTISGVDVTSSNVMVQSGNLQFKKSSGYLYNSTAMPGNITKITLGTATNFTIYVGTTANSETQTVTSGSAITGNYTFFKVKCGSSTGTTATITIEYSTGGTPTPSLSVSPASIAFGEKAINGSYEETFDVSFANLTEDLIVSGFSGVTVSPTTISKTATSPQTVTVTYAPTAEGSISGNITVGNTDDEVSQTVAVTGSAYDPSNLTYYEKVTSAPSSWEGDYIFTGINSEEYYALTGVNSNLGTAAAVTVTEDGIAATPVTNAYKVTIAQTTNGYSLYMDGVGYLSYSGSNNQLHASDEFEESTCEWTISFASGVATITNVGVAGRMLQFNYNNGNPRFACYTSSQVKITLFKMNDGTPSISANDVNIAFNATSGEISYTITNPIEGIFLSASTDADWLTLGNETSSPISFTCDANTETTARTATVTLTYGSVTKEVTVTQAAAPKIYTSFADLFDDATTTVASVTINFGNWVITGANNSQHAYLSDGTNGCMIFGSSLGFTAGDILSGIVQCKVQLYNGALELTELTNSTTGLTVSTGGNVTVADIAMADLAAINTGALLHYENLACTTRVEGSYTNYYLSDGTTEIQVYKTLFEGFAEYLENGKTYNITGIFVQNNDTKRINPRNAADIKEYEAPTHTVSFSVNGIVTSSVEVSEAASITFPVNPTDIEGKTFVGWTTEAITGTTDTEPTMVTSATMGSEDVTYYAVFATKGSGSTGTYTLDYTEETDLQETDLGYGKSVTYTAVDGSTWVIKAYKNSGMQINVGKNSSIKVPTCPGSITSVTVRVSLAKAVGFSANDYTGSGEITYLAEGTAVQNQTLDLSNQNVTTGYIVPNGGSTSITKIVVNYSSVTYSAYCTTVTTPTPETEEIKITSLKYSTYASDNALDFTESGIKAFYATLNEDGSTLTFHQIDVVPAGTGVLLYSPSAITKDIPVFTGTTEEVTENVFVRGTGEPVSYTETNYNYILFNGDNGIGFYKAKNNPVATNRAYIHIDSNSPVKYFTIDLDDDPTGIDNLNDNLNSNGVIYNLAGQRLQKMQKGINIINGKKVLK